MSDFELLRISVVVVFLGGGVAAREAILSATWALIFLNLLSQYSVDAAFAVAAQCIAGWLLTLGIAVFLKRERSAR